MSLRVSASRLARLYLPFTVMLALAAPAVEPGAIRSAPRPPQATDRAAGAGGLHPGAGLDAPGTPVPLIPQSFDLIAVRGDEPTDIVISPDGRRAYVPARNTDNLFVIALPANQVVAVVDLYPQAQHPLGPAPERLALTSDGQRLLITNANDNSLTVLNTQTLAVIRTLSLGFTPAGVAISPDGRVAYVAAMAAAKLAVVDPVVAQVIATLDVPHGGGAIGVAFAGDGRRAYLAMSAGDHVSVEVIDPATGAFTGAINVPYQGSQGALAISADGTRGYLALIERDLVAVLDLVAGRVVTTYAVTMPIGLELSADGSRLYAGTFGWMGESEYHIWLFDTRTGGLLAGGRYEHPAPYGRACSDIEGLALTPDGRTLYAASVDGDGVLVVDAATLAAAGMIPTHALAAFFPLRAVLSPDGALLYVASGIREPTTVSVVDTHSLAVVGEISGDPRGPCPSRSYGLDLSPDGHTLYLLASDANCLLLADTASRTIAGSYRIGESGKPLMHVAAHSDGRRLYVLDRAGTVFILNPASGVVTKTLTTIPDAYTVKLAPDGRRAYVGGGPGFAVLDLTTDMVLQVVDFGQTGGFGWLNRRTIGAKPDGSQFVVGDFWNLHVYDAGSGVEVRSVDLRTWNPLRTASTDAIFSADSRAGYLAMWDEKAVLAFDAVTWQVTAKIDVGRAPYFGLCPGWLVLSPDGRRLYAVAEEGDNVIAIDTGAGTVIRAIRVGRPYQRYLPMTLRKVARR